MCNVLAVAAQNQHNREPSHYCCMLFCVCVYVLQTLFICIFVVQAASWEL